MFARRWKIFAGTRKHGNVLCRFEYFRLISAHQKPTGKASPLVQYQSQIERKLITENTLQRCIVGLVDKYSRRIQENVEQDSKIQSEQKSAVPVINFLKDICRLFRISNRPATGFQVRKKGIYLYGDVGSGKTMIMDFFLNSFSEKTAKKIHFHRLMADYHQEAFKLRNGNHNLESIIHGLIGTPYVACLDEFQITDIADALIIRNILEYFLSRGIFLFITSNIAPENLYRNGIQRESFMPAIEVIRSKFEVADLSTEEDWRQHTPFDGAHYLSPCGEIADLQAQKWLQKFKRDSAESHPKIVEYSGRQICLPNVLNEAACFKFKFLCGSNQFSTGDYLRLAKDFAAFLIVDVPRFTEHDKDVVRKFINFIDAIYERRCELMMVAEANLDELFEGLIGFSIKKIDYSNTTKRISKRSNAKQGNLSEEELFAVSRCYSRIVQMVSQEWCANCRGSEIQHTH